MRNLNHMYKIFCYHKSRGMFWFRIFGRGFLFKNKKRCPLMLYSERNNIKGFTLGNIYIRYLGKSAQKKMKISLNGVITKQ